MHILYFHQHFSTPEGSGGTRSYEMARQLLAEGHMVTMVCGSYGAGKTGLAGPFSHGRRRGTVEGIDVIEFQLSYSNELSFTGRTWMFIRFALSSVKLALSEHYDIAFATTTPLTAGVPGIAARWLRRKPFVFEVRDLWPELPRAMGVITDPIVLAAMSALEWLSYRSAHRCVALSPGIARGIEGRGVPADRIEMVPNGCDLSLFGDQPTPWRPPEVSESELLAVYSGTHGIANGLDAVLDAAAVLIARGSVNVRLVLVGQGKEKPRLMTRAKVEGLSNVLFLDPISKRRLAGLLASADLGLQILQNVPAFYYGTSPNKFFDYLASGLPVLTNYPGWIASLIEGHDCGFAVAPGEPGHFADALLAAAADQASLRAKGERAKQLGREQFNRADLSRQWVSWVAEGRRRQPTVSHSTESNCG